MGTSQFYTYMGAIIYWILIKFCQSKLRDEMSEKNNFRNLILAGVFNFLVTLLIILFFVYN
jgi:L-asparagine transporter-like permease